MSAAIRALVASFSKSIEPLVKKLNLKAKKRLLMLAVSMPAVITFLLLAVSPTYGHAQTATSQGPFVTLLFSRTEMNASDNCVENDNDIAPLLTTVAPYLQSLGMTGTGTLETGVTQATAPFCTHYNDSLGASWSDATNLAENYGWSFVSHTATYPADESALTPAEQYAQTCSSAADIAAHGLPGANGLIAYPGSEPLPVSMQTNYGSKCFAWGRRYNQAGTTQSSAATTSPYWQETMAVDGGPCNTAGAPCDSITAKGNHRYVLPSTVIAEIDALKPGEWFTLQAYMLVTGTNPKYTQNGTQWNCTSSNPSLHWTNDTERYCYSDYQEIIQAIAALHDITVTDPLGVGIAFGRPSSYPIPGNNGAVNGTVTDTSDPNGLAGVCVSAESAGGGAIAGTATTASTGKYSISELSPGSYDIEFDPTCDGSIDSADSPQWYSNAATASAATLVNVTSATITPNINATLSPGGSVNGTVTDASDPNGLAGVCVSAESADGEPAHGEAVTSSTGAYNIPNLPSDSYDVEFDPTCGATLLSPDLIQWYANAASASDATPVPVSAGLTTDNINASLVTGTASSTDASAAPSISAVGSSVTYKATVTAANGTPTGIVTFSTSAGMLCSASLSGNIASCSSTGTPLGDDTVNAFYSGDNVFSDSTGSTKEDVVEPLIITTTAFPSGTVGIAYKVSAKASGGIAPYYWVRISGTNPPGLSFSKAGVWSGTPSKAGTYSFTIRVSDSSGMVTHKSFKISINK